MPIGRLPFAPRSLLGVSEARSERILSFARFGIKLPVAFAVDQHNAAFVVLSPAHGGSEAHGQRSHLFRHPLAQQRNVALGLLGGCHSSATGIGCDQTIVLRNQSLMLAVEFTHESPTRAKLSTTFRIKSRCGFKPVSRSARGPWK